MSRKLGVLLLKSVLQSNSRGGGQVLRRAADNSGLVYSRLSRLLQCSARGVHRSACLAATEDVKAPNFPDSISSGDVKFVKKEGDEVKMDEIVMEIETDKTAIPVMSPGNGKITKFYVKEGEAVKSQQVLFQVDVTSTTASAAPAGPAAAPPPAPAAGPAAAPAAAPRPAAAPAAAVAVKVSGGAPAARPVASGVRPDQITGTRQETAVKMNKMRLRIAQRLKEAQNTAAMLTTYNEIDMSKIIAFRKKIMDTFQKKHGVKLSFMSPFIKASVNALLDQPIVNAVIEGESIIYRDYVDISFAAATPRGLVVPVIRSAEKMDFAQIELAMSELANKAREGKLQTKDMVGGTFTISNGGVFGSLMSSPIINMPQSAILGMHATFQRPVAVNGKVEIRPMMYVALSYDHRIIDGREAVFFLRKVKSGVEDPATILASV